MKKQLHLILLMVFAVGFGTAAFAQENVETPHDTLAMKVNKMADDLAILKRIKFSGYIQSQYQIADSNGIASFEGGDFASRTDKRFMVRRARLKSAYALTNAAGVVTSEAVMQIDLSEKGIIVRDAFLRVSDPFKHIVSLKAGIFDRPFGYEIAYSSGSRETPERGRMSQTLFPGERELGAVVIIEGPKASKFEWFKAQGGYFGGNGAFVPLGGDIDFRKDFIGQVILHRSFFSERLALSGGFSYYHGGVKQGSDTTYTFDGTTKVYHKNVTSGSTTHFALREYLGADIQATMDSKLGLTTIRAEYIEGTQPSIGSKSVSPSYSTVTTFSSFSSSSSYPLTTFSTSTPGAPVFNLYSRHFKGYYFYFIQNLFHSKHDIVIKYDLYDPNTKVGGNDLLASTKINGVATATKLSAADIAYHTLGIGYVYHLDMNTKFTFYYAMVTNESTSADNTDKVLAHFKRDIADNVFTMRVQYKF